MPSGVESSIVVKPSYGLTDAEIAGMLQESFAHAADDAHTRALLEARVEADRVVAATESALADDSDLIDPSERNGIEDALAHVRRLRDGDDRAALHAAVHALNAATEAFAGRRMDRSVARALAGKRVDTIGS